MYTNFYIYDLLCILTDQAVLSYLIKFYISKYFDAAIFEDNIWNSFVHKPY